MNTVFACLNACERTFPAKDRRKHLCYRCNRCSSIEIQKSTFKSYKCTYKCSKICDGILDSDNIAPIKGHHACFICAHCESKVVVNRHGASHRCYSVSLKDVHLDIIEPAAILVEWDHPQAGKLTAAVGRKDSTVTFKHQPTGSQRTFGFKVTYYHFAVNPSFCGTILKAQEATLP